MTFGLRQCAEERARPEQFFDVPSRVLYHNAGFATIDRPTIHRWNHVRGEGKYDAATFDKSVFRKPLTRLDVRNHHGWR